MKKILVLLMSLLMLVGCSGGQTGSVSEDTNGEGEQTTQTETETELSAAEVFKSIADYLDNEDVKAFAETDLSEADNSSIGALANVDELPYYYLKDYKAFEVYTDVDYTFIYVLHFDPEKDVAKGKELAKEELHKYVDDQQAIFEEVWDILPDDEYKMVNELIDNSVEYEDDNYYILIVDTEGKQALNTVFKGGTPIFTRPQ